MLLNEAKLREELTITEDRLLREAASLGELLERLKVRVIPPLISARHRDRLSVLAGQLPVTLAAFPFGFELPLRQPRPGTRFNVSLVNGSRSAARLSRSRHCTGFAGLLTEIEAEGSSLSRLADGRITLEYDLDSATDGVRNAPGLFLYPTQPLTTGARSARRLENINMVIDAVSIASGQDPDVIERRPVERVCLALPPDTAIQCIGISQPPGRQVRLAVTGFRNLRDIATFLARADCPGQAAAAALTTTRLEASSAGLELRLDLAPASADSGTGLVFHARTGQSLKDSRTWTALTDSLDEQLTGVANKLAALAEPAQKETLFGKSGAFVLLRGVQHVRLDLSGTRVDQARAYYRCSLIMSDWLRRPAGANRLGHA